MIAPHSIKNKKTKQQEIHIEDILQGQESKGKNTADALQQALTFSKPDGYVATMPELVAAKIKAEKPHQYWNKRKGHNLWRQSYNVHTEENIGIDPKGRFYKAFEPVIVIINGGGLLTPQRIKKSRDKKIIQYSFEEFDNLLDGQLPNGEAIDLHTYEEIEKGISNLPHRFGVVMPHSLIEQYQSKYTYEAGDYYCRKERFVTNPLAVARIGCIENIESYYELAKVMIHDEEGYLGCYNFFGDGFNKPKGTLLMLNGEGREFYTTSNALSYDDLDTPTKFISKNFQGGKK